MSKFIGPYFPKSKIYVECFSGLARTAKHARSEIMILNDKSKHANKICKKKFSKAIVENMDFIDTLKKYDSKDTFFLIDPPWRTDFYDGYQNKSKTHRTTSMLVNIKSTYARKLGKYMTLKDRTLVPQLAFIDRTSKEYLEDLKRILPKLKGHYILTLESSMKFPSPYSKLLIHPNAKMFGFHPKTILFSNKPLEIQIPQITDYL